MLIAFGLSRVLLETAGLPVETLPWLPPVWTLLLVVLIPDFLLTCAVAAGQRRLTILAAAPAYPLMRLLDAWLCLQSLGASFRTTSTGRWSSPTRRVSAPAPSRVLAARYRDCLLGDLGGLFLLLAQAPLIGWLCAVVWGSIERDTPALYFVLCLAAVWFGCINACREIVKERRILERERLFGVRPRDYVLSKVWVLATLGAIQVVLTPGQ